MDGSHYDFSRDLAPASEPWWGRRLDTVRSAALMLAVAVVTFATIVALDGGGTRMEVAATTLAQGGTP